MEWLWLVNQTKQVSAKHCQYTSRLKMDTGAFLIFLLLTIGGTQAEGEEEAPTTPSGPCNGKHYVENTGPYTPGPTRINSSSPPTTWKLDITESGATRESGGEVPELHKLSSSADKRETVQRRPTPLPDFHEFQFYFYNLTIGAFKAELTFALEDGTEMKVDNFMCDLYVYKTPSVQACTLDREKPPWNATDEVERERIATFEFETPFTLTCTGCGAKPSMVCQIDDNTNLTFTYQDDPSVKCEKTGETACGCTAGFSITDVPSAYVQVELAAKGTLNIKQEDLPSPKTTRFVDLGYPKPVIQHECSDILEYEEQDNGDFRILCACTAEQGQHFTGYPVWYVDGEKVESVNNGDPFRAEIFIDLLKDSKKQQSYTCKMDMPIFDKTSDLPVPMSSELVLPFSGDTSVFLTKNTCPETLFVGDLIYCECQVLDELLEQRYRATWLSSTGKVEPQQRRRAKGRTLMPVYVKRDFIRTFECVRERTSDIGEIDYYMDKKRLFYTVSPKKRLAEINSEKLSENVITVLIAMLTMLCVLGIGVSIVGARLIAERRRYHRVFMKLAGIEEK